MKPVDISQDRLKMESLGPTVIWIAGLIGAAALVASVAVGWRSADGPARFYRSYLVSFCYFVSLSLGGLFFVLLQHLTRAAWSVVIRRLAEAIAANLLLMALLFVPILAGLGYLYEWSRPEAVAADALLQWKRPYLNNVFFAGRCAIYFVVWIWLARYMFSRSVRQDASGDPALTLKMERLSAGGMLLYAFTVTFAAFDWLMSLDARWFSTIYGVYFFSGSVVGFLATLAVTAYLLQHAGRLARAITAEHYHDIGKLLFGFVIFWAYIGFSQYMLIWYANIPEETEWLQKRQEDEWTAASLALLFGHFMIPAVALISRYPKRRRQMLAVCAAWMLAMHYIDLYWLAMPTWNSERLGLHILDVTCFVGIGGLFVSGIAFWLRDCWLLPRRDPRLTESLAFENA